MFGADKKRYEESIAYLKRVHLTLGTQVDNLLKAHASQIGAEISLSGAGYHNSGTEAQHKAVRALLLCQIAFFRPPHCDTIMATKAELDRTRALFRGATETQVREEILTYVRVSNPTLNDLATAAETAKNTGGNLDYLRIRRDDLELGKNIVCYTGLMVWLYMAGFVSKRWLAGPGRRLNAWTANTIFGKMTEVKKQAWHTIPRGYLWSIQSKQLHSVCHWGVSLGNGQFAATNNTTGSRVIQMKFKEGSKLYGRGNFVELCTMLNSTMAYGNAIKVPVKDDALGAMTTAESDKMPSTPDKYIVVKMMDPSASPVLY